MKNFLITFSIISSLIVDYCIPVLVDNCFQKENPENCLSRGLAIQWTRFKISRMVRRKREAETFGRCQFARKPEMVNERSRKITKYLGNNTFEIKLEDRWCTHACVFDFPDAGNTIEIADKSTLEVVGSLTVLAVDTFPKEWRSVLKLSGELPGNYRDYYFIDVTRLPALEFVNCYVGSHLARAVLVKTRNMLIENCMFREGTETAIHIGAEGDWREGQGSENVTIRNNRILRCGRGDGTNDGACGIAINVKCRDNTKPGIHKNIVIEQNIIEGVNTFTGISIQRTKNATLLNNRVTGCSKAVNVKHSANVEIQE